jgi:YfiH family protein
VIYRATDGYYRSALLDALPWLEHRFGARRHGDWLSHAPAAKLRQIHSAIVWSVNGETGYLGEGDALHSATSTAWLAVRTADCAPVILADSRQHAVAMIHAGWRGAAANILAATVASMQAAHGTAPEELIAAIGPSIGTCCFEVGPEVAAQFTPWVPALNGATCNVYLDLTAVLRLQLLELGVQPTAISAAAPCTRCLPEEFHSFRRDKHAAGRMVSAVRIAR